MLWRSDHIQGFSHIQDTQAQNEALAQELEALRYNPIEESEFVIDEDVEIPLEKINGNSLEILIEMESGGARQFGLKVCASPDGQEQTLVFYDAVEKKLKIDTNQSSLVQGRKSVEAGPFELKNDERLTLRLFVDKSVVEVFANGRQAVTRRIYPSRKDSVGVTAFSRGGATKVVRLKAWDMMPSNPY